MTAPYPHGLFEVTGIELEYMIVDRDDLSVKPIADELIRAECGRIESEIERGPIAWSNELALHVIELKTNGPVPDLTGLAARFQENLARMDEHLASRGARLMPTSMHPWMDPHRELSLWPHEYNPVYEAFHRIFDCRGHGWANLQSLHINLPFRDDEEFARLHESIRLLLPVLPALAASSPFADGRRTGFLDTRMDHYRANSRRVPSVSGHIVPEPVFSRADYESQILDSIYRDLAPHDPAGVLRYEWANARGSIARFDRGAIEIRVLDVQEAPIADLAVAAAILSVLRWLASGDRVAVRAPSPWRTEELADILGATVRDADRAVLRDLRYLDALGYPGGRSCTAGELWSHLVETHAAQEAGFPEWREALTVILREGCLARRIDRAAGPEPGRERLREIYRELCRCLEEGVSFRA